MLHLPARFATVILPFATMFMQQRTWRHAQLLLLGALLTPGQRTICAILRMVGLRWERHFVTYHRVLNRAAWRDRAGTRLLFDLLVAAFAPHGPVLLGVDDTIERRRGKRISAKGIYRDPVRSSKSFFVKTSGLRWLSLMLLAPIGWAGRVWALPFLTVLAPSERYCRIRGLRHKTLTDWARQVALRARRWLPGREIILVGDSSFAALDLLAALRHHGMICVTRLRLDAALYEPAPPRKPGTKDGRARRAPACLHSPRCWRTLPRAGRQSASPTGMARPSGASRSARKPRCGSTAACHPCHSAGCCCAIPRDSSTRRHCCAPIPTGSRCRSSAGSSSAGPSRSPSAKRATTSGSRASANGPIVPSPAPHPASWACSPSPLCSAINSTHAPSSPPQQQPGTTRPNPPSPTHSPPCARKSGPLRVFPSRAPDQIAENCRAACARVSSTPL